VHKKRGYGWVEVFNPLSGQVSEPLYCPALRGLRAHNKKAWICMIQVFLLCARAVKSITPAMPNMLGTDGCDVE
jgi:hypothetical protein